MDRPLAVVTGVTTSLGRELARQCIVHGFDVVVIGERADDAIRRRLGADVAAVYSHTYDLSTSEGVEAAVRAIEALGRPVEALLIAGPHETLVRRLLPAMSSRARVLAVSPTAPLPTRVTCVEPSDDDPVLMARQAWNAMMRGKPKIHAGTWQHRLAAWFQWKLRPA
jgi:NAD(P)-dependent dehydrogenase (short-subunit alcohol dehydrogenase family)